MCSLTTAFSNSQYGRRPLHKGAKGLRLVDQLSDDLRSVRAILVVLGRMRRLARTLLSAFALAKSML